MIKRKKYQHRPGWQSKKSVMTYAFTIRPETLEQLSALAKERNSTSSALVREAIDLYLNPPTWSDDEIQAFVNHFANKTSC